MKNKLFLLIIFLLIPLYFVFSQNKSEYLRLPIAFYNLENFFDAEDGENNDADFTPKGSNRWTNEKVSIKTTNLARVISEIGGNGPAIIGVSEVENRGVLENLVREKSLKHRSYNIIHYDSPDKRGIDCAILYDPSIFLPISSGTRFVDLGIKDYFTRDILYATGKIDNEIIHILVGHWPSRVGGEAKSAPNRLKAAKVMKSVADSLLQAYPSSKVIMMGDFNDDPISKSLTEGLKVKKSFTHLGYWDYYNPMQYLYDKGIGTLAYRDGWNLFDNIVVNGTLIGDDLSTFKIFRHKGYIFHKQYLSQKLGRYKDYPMRTLQSGRFQKNGYSDHFPVFVLLVKKRNLNLK